MSPPGTPAEAKGTKKGGLVMTAQAHPDAVSGASGSGRALAIARRIGRLAVVVTALAVIVLALTGPAYRAGIAPLMVAFAVMRYAAIVTGIAGLLSLVGLWPAVVEGRRGGVLLSLAALVVAAVAFWLPYHQMRIAYSVPPIHDITTDTDNPPAFVAVLPLRVGAPNTADYEGEKIAEQQRKGYPDLKPLLLAGTPEAALTRALDVAKAMGWTIVAFDQTAGRLEATDTTFWYGFKDDIVVRAVAEGDGTKLDVRSVSRVGRSDVGKNAARIRDFLRRMQAS
jgi:uncharacterized protein (DUF1499 family)